MPLIDKHGYTTIRCQRCATFTSGKADWCMCPGCLTHWREPKYHVEGEAFLRAYPDHNWKPVKWIVEKQGELL